MNTYSNASVLSAEGISKTLGGRQIIRDVNVRLGENELVCLLGQSGAGKTTLFHVIAGLYRPDEGRVLLNGQE
ncbi:MAG: ATP-binding cassette domain-containing protein, partial [Clostridia bacterium]|nr:ATP-binding cassette domain-containing protein [Clostridia bacterium]